MAVDNEEMEGNDRKLRDWWEQPNQALRIQIGRYLTPNGEATQLGVNFDGFPIGRYVNNARLGVKFVPDTTPEPE